MILLIICIDASSVLCRENTVIIPIQFRRASEVMPIVQNLLSQSGKAAIDVRTNSVIITDSEEAIRKIQEFLKRYDIRPKQVRVRVRFHEVSSARDRSIGAEGSVSGKGWKITTGKKRRDGVEVRLGDKTRRQKKASEYFVNVMSGNPAYILAGKDILYKERWVYLLGKYAGYKEKLVVQRMETGFDVRPSVAGDHANVEITPRISHEAQRGRKEVVRFTGAATTLSVPLGQWVTIGGIDEKSNEVIREILETGTRKKNSSLEIVLMVELH